MTLGKQSVQALTLDSEDRAHADGHQPHHTATALRVRVLQLVGSC